MDTGMMLGRRYSWRPMADSSSTGTGPATRALVAVIVVGAPWLWFVLRWVGGPVDILAVGLPAVGVPALIGLGALAAVRRRLLPLLAGLSIFAVCVAATITPRIPRHDPAPTIPIRIAVANVYDRNDTPDDAAAALVGRDVDVMAAVEMKSGFWQRLVIGSDLPYAVSDSEMGVRSRYPIKQLSAGGVSESRLIRVRVDVPGAPFVLYLVHLLNPFHDSSSFSDQRAFVRSIVQAADFEQRPVVIVGDFNMSDRSENYRIMDTAFADAMREGDVPASTYFGGLWPMLLVRIDHAFVSRGWCAENGSTFAVPGSDHHGIQVTVGPCP
jgi:endonuclease/exonuclease/phosphatase (EEP) superfamily protein YafD